MIGGWILVRGWETKAEEVEDERKGETDRMGGRLDSP